MTAALVALGLEAGAEVGRAPVLPDDGAVDGLARPPIPDARVVSRWLVMPIAAMSDGARPGCAQGLAAGRERSCARDPPARARPIRRPGSAAANSCCATAAIEVSGRNRMARVEVVPWSMARMRGVTIGSQAKGGTAVRPPSPLCGRGAEAPSRGLRQARSARERGRRAAPLPARLRGCPPRERGGRCAISSASAARPASS